MPERTKWSDERLDDHMLALTALPQSVATLAVTVNQSQGEAKTALAAIEQLRRDQSERDRRLHERIDDVLEKIGDRDREYRRNIVLVIGPVAVTALLIAAKVAFGLDLPGGG